MTTTRNRTAYTLGLLGTLYFSQGLPFGFFTQALPVFLRERGMSLEEIGLTSLLALPWALKFLWAPLVDGVGATRRVWILPLQLCAAAAMGAAALIDPEASLTPLLVLVFLANLLAATQDIATDGLAVDTLTHAERGLGNGVQVAGYRVGMIVGGGAMLIAFEHVGWMGTFATLAALLTLATVPIATHREAPRVRAVSPTEHVPFARRARRAWGALANLITQPGMLAWFGVLFCFKFGESLSGGMLRPFLVDLELTTGEIGWLLGGAGFAAGLVGALLGGWLTGLMSRRHALLSMGALQVVGVSAYFALAALGLTSNIALYSACVVEHLTGGMATATLFTSMMDACREDSAATDYTAQASAVVLTSGVGAALSGFVAGQLGYAGHFGLGTALAALGMVGVLGLLGRTHVR